MPIIENIDTNNQIPQKSLAESFIKKHASWNYIFNFLDGAFFWLGYAFIAPGVILPLFISHFTDNKLLIGLVAMIGASGWFLPQLFTSNWVEKMPIKKDAPVKIGFFTERVPIGLLPISALLSISSPHYALALFFIFWMWHSLGAGVVAVAWQDMIAKVIPLKTRGFFMGITTLAGNATGVVGAILAANLLDRFTFPTGFVYNFSIAAILIFLSWIFLALVREFPSHNTKSTATNLQFWTRLPLLLKLDKNFSWFLISQVIGAIGGMAWGFLAVYARQKWNLSDGQTGNFNIWLLVGQSLGNLLGGLAGDRFGYKRVILSGFLFIILAQILVLVAPTPVWMTWVFLFRGISLGLLWLASLMVLEFSLPDVRPTYIGINNTLLGLSAMIAPLLGGWVAQAFSYKILFFTAMILSVLSLFFFIRKVKDPRHIR